MALIEAVTTLRKPMPVTITSPAITLPSVSAGTWSP